MAIHTNVVNSARRPSARRAPSFHLRPYQGPQDFAHILALINGCKAEDGVERSDSLESITHFYNNLRNCDLSQDLWFAQVGDQVVGYNRVWWEELLGGAWQGCSFGMVLPAYRGQGIGSRLLQTGEDRLRQLAAAFHQAHPEHPQTDMLINVAYHSEQAHRTLLEQNGYQVVRVEHHMLRPDLENIPEAPMPEGLEVRPVLPEDLPVIFQATIEAFQDHWGFTIPTDSDYEGWLNDPNNDFNLWRVAWDGSQVAGSVQSFINKAENEEYRRLRGYTETISVRRNWRRRGLARALLVRSLQAIKDAGMRQGALSVDSQNLNQAFALYESVGFQVVNRQYFYNKPL